MVLSARSLLSVLCQTCTMNFLNLFQQFDIDAFRIIDPACGVRYGNDFCAHLLSFLAGIDSNVSGTGYAAYFAFHGFAVAFHQLTGQIQKSITSCLSSCKRSAVGQALSGQNAGKFVAKSFILTEKIAYLSRTYTDISGGNVCVRSYML